MPNVEVQIVEFTPKRDSYVILAKGNSSGTFIQTGKKPEGELLVKGPNVFKEYLNKPQATKTEFTKDGWFITGKTLYEN